ncbi:alpha/beta hydrolase fold domain-containing protein [Altererythrobacter salegens]|uniref:Alpha/beta hydrolase fold domain-containing protein n=1 Tax=Croceibacterium salegens TaxID=1737568 RepID=A0A6I4SWG1_9SPHN|nr:alpha/beta hydrolase [Croceibacterium salegens]MXO58682.1 alpha/beta hydrolase fold domain-containing protein [Croceibacterium salegens]
MASNNHFVRDDVRAFLDYLASLNQPMLYELPVEEARAGARAMGPMVDAEPRELAVIKDHTCPGPGGDIPLRLYDSQADRKPGPAIVFYHGGGFVVGDIEVYHSLCTEIAAETGLPVISVDYRLAPEHPFPAAPDDCEAATRWVAGSPAELGFEVTGLVPMGDSAGGNLTIVTTAALMAKPAAVPVVAQVPIYPIANPIAHHSSFREFADGFFLTSKLMGWFTDQYAGDESDPRMYPMLADDHSMTPPTVVLTAGLDPLRDSGREYAAHLIGQGVDVTCLEARGINHGFITMRKAIPSGQADLKRVYTALAAMMA